MGCRDTVWSSQPQGFTKEFTVPQEGTSLWGDSSCPCGVLLGLKFLLGLASPREGPRALKFSDRLGSHNKASEEMVMRERKGKPGSGLAWMPMPKREFP